MAQLNDVKFNNQGFVTSYITEIIELIKPQYDNILTLDTTDKSLPETIALLTGKTNNLKLPNLKTYQYNSLIPKIRLFRVNSQDDSEYEFLFNKDYLLEHYMTENTPLQMVEDIEWLKILEQGYKIHVVFGNKMERGIDTPDDYEYLCNKYKI